ncbi:MAG: hypothetical protein IKN54_02240 [Lachnospiraceae bacterium]|nr:hypothetical protein [Lachnospiraceae bacterium]
MTGRPKKPDDEKKTYQVRVMLTKAESEKLNYCAETLQITRSAVMLAGLDCVYDDIKNEKSNG